MITVAEVYKKFIETKFLVSVSVTSVNDRMSSIASFDNSSKHRSKLMRLDQVEVYLGKSAILAYLLSRTGIRKT